MLKHYTFNTFRQLSGNRLFTFINIVGLALGLASFILIALFVKYELSYESSFSNADRIYRISRDYYATGDSSASRPAGMPAPAAALLKEDFPEIKQVARIFCCGAVVKTEGGEAVLEGGYAMADSTLFEIFDFDWISGDPATALDEPYTVVLTRSAAERHFGGQDPMGQTLQYGGGQNWQLARVTGVIEDLPDNTHLQFDILESNLAWTDCDCEEQEQTTAYFNDWGNDIFYTYVLLREGASIDRIQSQAGEFFERHLAEGVSARTSYTARAIGDIHLQSNRDSELWLTQNAGPEIGMATLYTFSAIAVFILLLACINFMNLATALGIRRAREVGIRKAMGADRKQLAGQFMLESFVLVTAAALVAVVLVEAFLPAYSEFLVRELVFTYAGELDLLLMLVLLVVFTAVVAGSYPAFYLSGLKPGTNLRDRRGGGKWSSGLRQSLVVTQFAIAIVLLCTTAAVHQQMRFIKNTDPGYNRDNLLVLSPNSIGGEEWSTIEQQWLTNPDVLSVTSSYSVPFQPISLTAAFSLDGEEQVTARMSFVNVGYGFFSTYEIDVLAGREFSQNYGTDRYLPDEAGGLGTQPFILSASAVRELGLSPEEAIGRRLEFSSIQGARFQTNEARGAVVGVVEDAQFESLHNSQRPLVFIITGSGNNTVTFRTTGQRPEETRQFIETTYRQFRPDQPTNIAYLEQRFESAYQREQRQQAVLTVFASFAVFIACLGLLGLATHAAQTRTKEIGMGGSISRIVMMLTNDFSKLVLISNVIAWPVAYIAINHWLENFAYRIDLTPMIFIGSGLIALCIAWAMVGGTAAKAASQKPVLALRYE